MDLEQLATVVAVAQHRNFTHAAAALHVSQPALSLRIRSLERELGVTLFDRTTRRVMVTAAGEILVASAQRILAELEATGRSMAEFAGLVRGRVRLGAWYTINPELPRLLAGFIEHHPQFDISIREENSDVMLDLLRSGDLDVALPIVREGLDWSELDHLVYRREPFVLMVNRRSPLARRPEVRLSDLAEVPLIVLKPGSAVRYLVDHAFDLADVHPRIVVETAETAGARAFVAYGLGAALVPASTMERQGPSVAVVRIADAPIRVSALAWRLRGRAPATDAFLDYVRQILSQMSAWGAQGHV